MMESKNRSSKKTLKTIANVISWSIFTFLIICALLLIYYFVATKIYEKKGKGYEPLFSLYTIISPSMVPNINVYDVVVDAPVKDPKSIKIGDIITFNSTDFTIGKSISVTHRVKEIIVDLNGEYSYVTKGDNNITKDNVPVPFKNITGKVLMRIPQLGRIQFFIASKAGWLLVIVIPALFIIIKDVLRMMHIIGKKEKKKKDDNTDLSTSQKLEQNNSVNSNLYSNYNNSETGYYETNNIENEEKK